MNIKLKLSRENIYTYLSFMIPVVIRAIPELRFPYPIGFDTPLYLAFGKEYAQSLKPYPLFNFILGLIYLDGVDLLPVMKILPTLIYGFVGFSIFRFVSHYLKWEDRLSFLTSVSATFSVSLLRISWDMHKLTLGIALLFLSSSYLKELGSRRNQIIFIFLSILTIVSHELITVAYLWELIIYIFFTDDDKARLYVSIIILIGIYVFIGLWYISNLERVFGWLFKVSLNGLFTNTTYETVQNLTLFIKLYLFMLPFALIGYIKEKILNSWLIFTLAGSFTTIISPHFYLGDVLPWRYILLVILPLSIYTVNGVVKILKSMGKYNIWMLLFLILIISFPSISFIGLSNHFQIYYENGVMPKNMIETSIPLKDIEATIRLLSIVDGNSKIIVYGDFIGWAKYYTDAEVITFSGTYPRYKSLYGAFYSVKGDGKIYLLWWNDKIAIRLGFEKIAQYNTLSLYLYEGD